MQQILAENSKYMLIQKNTKSRSTLTLWNMENDDMVFEQIYHLPVQTKHFIEKRDEALKLFV